MSSQLSTFRSFLSVYGLTVFIDYILATTMNPLLSPVVGSVVSMDAHSFSTGAQHSLQCNGGNWWQLVVRWRWEHYLIPIRTWFEATHPSQVPDPWPGHQEGSDDRQHLPVWQTWRITFTPEVTALCIIHFFILHKDMAEASCIILKHSFKWPFLLNFFYCN